jgi:molecular chaperone DnaK
MTKLIEKNTTIPTKAQQTFSTAEDNQTAVTVHVLQGEREMAKDNKSLGRFDLTDIPPSPRGVPQIEVTFDIDANGILHVSAKDKATGRETGIEIKASSGLSDDEIDRMVKEAEQYAEEDQRQRELVEAHNQADSMIHATRKSLSELGENVGESEKKEIEDAISELEKAVEGDDKEDIEQKTQSLAEKSGKLAEKAYQQQSSESGAGTAGGSEDFTSAAGGGETSASSRGSGEDVVDAEFEEVKDDDSSNKK